MKKPVDFSTGYMESGERSEWCPSGAFAEGEKRGERVNRNEQCEARQASSATIEIAGARRQDPNRKITCFRR